MKYLTVLKHLTISEILSIAAVVVIPVAIFYHLLVRLMA
jgi:hypothetical protein